MNEPQLVSTVAVVPAGGAFSGGALSCKSLAGGSETCSQPEVEPEEADFP